MSRSLDPRPPLALLLAAVLALVGAADAPAQEDPRGNIGHRRHLHPHNPKHETTEDATRFATSREGRDLPLPVEEPAFTFVVFGDRTGGPDEGVSVLADAVRDVNLLEPDLVMTVGDLIDGYNQTDAWMAQMHEYRTIMDHLRCPWFPVAGNHDIYWRGPAGQKPEGEHERSYEIHFGPLWYAFEHKDCWFIALYSDEGNPRTAEKSFTKPSSQKMSPEQFDWLAGTLERTRNAEHVFLFLHHPRWLGGGYGDDWNRVHELLVAAGNVTAVFAGHIHQMRYDPRDGIEYVTLATVGGVQSGIVPDAGWLHHYEIVTVRESQIALASVPVGEVMDVREITGELHDEAGRLARRAPDFGSERIELRPNGSAGGWIRATYRNDASLPLEVMASPRCDDSRWFFGPDHDHTVVEPGESAVFRFRVTRPAGGFDETLRVPELSLAADMIARGARYSIPERRYEVPLDVELPPVTLHTDGSLTLDGSGAHLRIPSRELEVPDGPLTLECRFEARSYGSRTGLVAKTEMSEYGIFVSNGRPSFSILIGPRYLEAAPSEPMLETGRWYHVAGVYDGEEARLYVDGDLVASAARKGPRRTNALPFIVGADVDGRGNPVSFFDGRIDEVRISTAARYRSERFDPPLRHEPDPQTALLLHLDGTIGPWTPDASPSAAHAVPRGGAVIDTPATLGAGR